MNGYKIRRGEVEWQGSKGDGWIVFDVVGPEAVVATILSGDSGQVFKEKLISAGAIEEQN